MKDEDKTKEQLVDELIELRQRITEIEEMAKRKQAEEAPRESEKRFRDLFENSPDAMFVEDLDGNVLDVNPAACRLHGTGHEDLIGKNVLELVPPDKRVEVARDFLKLVDGERDHVEGFSLTKDGRLVPVEIRASRIDYSGKPAILLDVRDITERKRTEETLRRYAQRLETLLMENARLFEAEQRRAEQFRLISEVGRRITSILAVDELLGEIVRLVKETLGYYLVGIGLIEGDELIFKAGAGSIWETPRFQPPRLKVGREGITGWVAQSGEPLLVPDVSREPRYYFMPQASEIRSELAVPLKTKEAVIGVLHVQSDHLNAFDQTDLAVLQSLAHQAAIAIENARLYEEEHRRSLQRKTIAEVGRAIAAILDLDTLLSRVVDLIAQNFGYYFVHVFEVDAEAGYVVFKAGTGEAGRLLKEERNRLRIGEEGIIGWVAYSGQPLMVNDTDKEPRYYFHPALADTRSELAVPIRLGERIIGVLDVQSEEPNAFRESDLATLETLADQLAIAIENARLYEQAEQRMRELEALYRAEEDLNRVEEELYRHLRLDQLLQALVDVAVDILQADKSSLLVWDAQQERLVMQAARGFSPETMAQMSFALGEGGVGRVAASGEPMFVEDTLTDPRVARRVTEPEAIRSLMHVLIKTGGQLFGVLSVGYARPRAFSGDDQRLFLALAQRAGPAIENARLYEQAQQVATLEERQRLARELHDAVTQTLFSASLIAEVLPRLWERDPDEGRRRLEELRQLTRGALAEMRTLLLELRPVALVEAEIGDLLRQLAEATTGRARVPVTVTVEGQHNLPPDVQVALYRIAHEALNNVTRHAGASQATVSLRCISPEIGGGQRGGVELRVSDDGHGFDPSYISPEHLGLGIMRERAEAIGATLRVESQPGHGTQVVVVWEEEGQETEDAF